MIFDSMTIQFDRLTGLLNEIGIQAEKGVNYRFGFKELKASAYYSEAAVVYQKLGGLLREPPAVNIRPAVLLNQKVFLEIDGVLHFNRYRMATLRSHVYAQLNGVNTEHKRFCKIYEKEFVKSGLTPGLKARRILVLRRSRAISLAADRLDGNSPPTSVSWKICLPHLSLCR